MSQIEKIDIYLQLATRWSWKHEDNEIDFYLKAWEHNPRDRTALYKTNLPIVAHR